MPKTSNFQHYKRCRAYETAFELKRQGKIRHVGLSFHDTADILDQILTEYPEIEVVQIQFNYLDYDSDSIQSKRCYDVCVKHGKPIIVMEPVKGGTLVNLPPKAKEILDAVGTGSYASYAVRFALHYPQIAMVLSGMSSIEQMNDNISSTKDYRDLSDEEMAAIVKVREYYNSLAAVQCTHCSYCIEQSHCPKDILIPEVFAAYNGKISFHEWTADGLYKRHVIVGHGKASDCIKCGACERVCPQHLHIRELLEKAAEVFGE